MVTEEAISLQEIPKGEPYPEISAIEFDSYIQIRYRRDGKKFGVAVKVDKTDFYTVMRVLRRVKPTLPSDLHGVEVRAVDWSTRLWLEGKIEAQPGFGYWYPMAVAGIV